MATKTEDITTKIAIEGEKEYKSACDDIGKSLKEINSAMRLTTAEYASNAGSTEALKAKQALLNSTLEEQQKKVAAAETALAKFQAAGEGGADGAQKMQIALNNAKAAAASTENQIAALGSQIEQNESASTKYNTAAAAIDTTLGELGTELKMVNAQYGSNAGSAEALEAKQKLLNATLEEQQKKVDAAQQAYAEACASQGEMSEEARNMKSALMEAKTGMYETENSLKSIDGQLNATSSDVDSGSSKWAAFGSALGTAAKAVGTAMAAIGTAAVGAASALAGLTVAGSTYADDLITQATYTRQSTDDLQKYGYACRFIDTDMGTLTDSMKKNQKAMNSAAGGSKEVSKAYKKLGVSVKNSDGTFRASDEVYWEVIDALGSVEDETQRSALAQTILGKSANELNSIIDSGSEAFKAYGDEAEQMGLVMGEESLSKLGAFNDKLQVLEGGMDGLKNAASLIALPFLDELAGDGIDILGEFTSGINAANGDLGEMAKVVSKTLSKAVKVITKQLPKFVSMGVDMVKSIISGLTENLGDIADAAVEICTCLLDGIMDLLPEILNGAVQIVVQLANGISKALPTLVPKVAELLTTITTAIIDNLPALLDAGLQIITGLVTGIANALPVLVAALPTIITAIVNTLTSSIDLIVDAGITLLTSLIDAIPQTIVALTQALPEIITAIVNGLMEGVPKLLAAIPEIVTQVWAALQAVDWIGLATQLWTTMTGALDNGLSTLWAGISTWGAEFYSNMKTALGLGEGATLWDVGAELWKRLCGFISTAMANLGTWLAGIGAKLLEYMKKELGLEGDASLWDVGAEIWKKITASIGAAITALKEQCAAWGKQLRDWILSGFGTFSGSGSLTGDPVADMGKNIILDAAGGAEKEFPTFNSTINSGIDGAMSGATDGLTNTPESVGGNLASGIGTGFADGMDGQSAVAGGSLMDMMKDVESQFGIHSPSTWTRDNIGKMLSAGVGEGFATDMSGATKAKMNTATMEAANSVIDTLLKTIKSRFTEVTNLGAELSKQLATGITNATNVVTATVQPMISALISAFSAQHSNVYAEGQALDQQLAGGINSAVYNITATVPGIISQTISAFTAQHGQLYNEGQQFSGQIASGISAGASSISSAASSAVKTALNAVKDIADDFSSAGKQCVQGIWEGFQDMSGWLENKVRAMMRKIVAAVKDEMDIHSPSRVFADIGRNMAAGIGVGYVNAMSSVADRVAAATTQASGAAATRSASSGGTSNAGAPAISVTQNIYANQTSYAEQQREAAWQLSQIARAML